MNTLEYDPLINPFSNFDPTLASGGAREQQIIDLPMAEQRVVIALSDTLEAERKRREENERHLLELAQTDDLTGLPNRRGFNAEVRELLDSGVDMDDVVLLVFDLDHFKDINDTLGHAKGDEVLVASANWIRGNTRDSDGTTRGVPGRMGGDEFVVLADLTPDTQTSRNMTKQERCDALLNRLGITFEEEVRPTVGETVPGFSYSVGVAFYKEGMTPAEWLETAKKAADNAMYQAKVSKADQR